MGKCLIKVRIHCLLYLHLAFFYELCDFPQIVRSDVIWGELCEISPSRNIRWPDCKIKYHHKYSRLCFRLGKTERSPVLWTSESQGTQHIYHFIKKLRFLQSLSLRLQFRPVKIHRRSLAKIASVVDSERGVQTGKPSLWTEKLIVGKHLLSSQWLAWQLDSDSGDWK